MSQLSPSHAVVVGLDGNAASLIDVASADSVPMEIKLAKSLTGLDGRGDTI